jgi:hypothetical protein
MPKPAAAICWKVAPLILLLVLPGLELRGPRAVVAPVLCLLYGIACFGHARHSSFTTLDFSYTPGGAGCV